jgi:inosine-uridine nucleoside N-ribohydrolase
MSKKLTVHLDTDIGDDIDDAFCLSLLLRSPEIELKSITTVLNDTAVRSDMCRELCDAAGQSPKIMAGARSVITRRAPARAIGRTPPHKATKTYDYKTDIAATLATLAEVRQSYDVLLTIGPKTNLAMSLVADPDVSRFPRYLAMAGEVQIFGHQEWNIVVDAEAAAVVCTSGVAMDFIPFKIGIDTKLTEDEQAWLEKQTNPVARVLNNFRAQFRKTHARIQNMFDPMTVVALLHDDWFTWKRGQMTVETRGDATNGLTTFRYDENGPHRVAFAVDVDKAKQWMLQRLGD